MTFLKVREAAAAAKVSPKTIYAAVGAKDPAVRLRAARFGVARKEIRIAEPWLLDWMERLAQGTEFRQSA